MRSDRFWFELHGCVVCGAVVVDRERHRSWHVATRAGVGEPLEYLVDFEFVGLVEADERLAG